MPLQGMTRQLHFHAERDLHQKWHHPAPLAEIMIRSSMFWRICQNQILIKMWRDLSTVLHTHYKSVMRSKENTCSCRYALLSLMRYIHTDKLHLGHPLPPRSAEPNLMPMSRQGLSSIPGGQGDQARFSDWGPPFLHVSVSQNIGWFQSTISCQGKSSC